MFAYCIQDVLMLAHVGLCLHFYLSVQVSIHNLCTHGRISTHVVWPVYSDEKTDLHSIQTKCGYSENKASLNQMHQPAIFDTVAIWRAFKTQKIKILNFHVTFS